MEWTCSGRVAAFRIRSLDIRSEVSFGQRLCWKGFRKAQPNLREGQPQTALTPRARARLRVFVHSALVRGFAIYRESEYC